MPAMHETENEAQAQAYIGTATDLGRPCPGAARSRVHPTRGRTARAAAALRAVMGAVLVLAGMPSAHAQTAPAPTLAPTPAPALTGEVLLVLRQADALPGLQARHRLALVGRFGQRPIYRLRVPPRQSIDATIAALAAEPAVLVAEPNLRRHAPEGVKNNVWAVGRAESVATQWAGPALQAPLARTMGQGGRGVRVALLDTGFDLQHPALAGRWLPGRDFVDGDLDPSDQSAPARHGHGHGTHVAGLVAWMAPEARLMPLRVLDDDGQGNAWVLAEALMHAIDPDGNPATDDGAHVVNLSLAGAGRSRLMATVHALASCNLPDADHPDIDLSDPGYAADRERCGRAAGAVVVAAAGNDGGTQAVYPAAEGAYGLLAVAASHAEGRLASFSNRGGWVHVSAPGEAVHSTVPGGAYAGWSGTSMAAALASGSVALARAAHPQRSAREITRCLTRTAQPLAERDAPPQLRPADALIRLAQGPRACR